QWAAAEAGTVTGAYVSGTVVGGFIGRVASGQVAAAMNWRASFAVIGLLSFICAMVLAARLPADVSAKVHGTSRAHAPRRALAAHLTSKPLLGTYAAGFCVLFTQIAMFTYVTFHLADPPFELTTAALGWLFVVYLAGAIITPVSGRWIDAYGHR